MDQSEENYSSDGGESLPDTTAVQHRLPMPTISKKDALKNWLNFDMAEELAESLVANQFMKPTEI